MKKKILIIKNNTKEGPGLLEKILKDQNIKYLIIDLDKKQQFPPTKQFEAIIVLGGPDSANDENIKMQQELSHISEFLKAKIPYLGICLGLQALVKSAGGKIIKSPIKEVGFRGPDDNLFTVELTAEGQKDPFLKGIENTLNVFHLHGETVELTNEMVTLGVGKFCRNQIVRVGTNAYGTQFHFELTPEIFAMWMNEDPDFQPVDKEKLQKDFKITREKYVKVSRKLFENFLKLAGFQDTSTKMRDKRWVAEHRGGPLKKEQHRQLIKWACDCAEHVFPLLDEKIDDRLKNALFIAKEWGKGKASVGEARNASVNAHAVARESLNPIAIAIARAVGHAVATAHMADHSLGPALYALKAVKLAGKSMDAEREWQNKQLPPEIKELVLSTRTAKEKTFVK